MTAKEQLVQIIMDHPEHAEEIIKLILKTVSERNAG